MREGRFAGRVAIVTGAGHGIGAEVGRRLAEEGAAVALWDIDSAAVEEVAAGIRARGGGARAYGCDVGSPEQVAATVERVGEELGAPGLAVSAAGVVEINPFLDLPLAVWERTLRVNLTGTFLVLQGCGRAMVRAGHGGRMVALASVAGRGPRADCADYAASKAGVISVVRSAALALAPHKITVNAVCPGVVDTEMTRRNARERARQRGVRPEEALRGLVAGIPLGRIETAADVAAAVSFLLSEEGGYVTGQALNVCGGLEFD